jgi:hypothetical protein
VKNNVLQPKNRMVALVEAGNAVSRNFPGIEKKKGMSM